MTKQKEKLIESCFEKMEKLSSKFDHYMWSETSMTHIREIDRRLNSLNEFLDMFFELHPGYHE